MKRSSKLFFRTKFLLIMMIVFIIVINLSIYFFVFDFISHNEQEKINIYSSFVVNNLKNLADELLNNNDIINYNGEKLSILIEENIGELNNYQWQIIVINKKGYLLYDSIRYVADMGENEKDMSEYPGVKNALLGSWGVKKIKINNENYYTSSAVVGNIGWIIVFQIKESIFLNKVYKLILPQAGLTFIIINFIFLTGYFFIKKVLMPIETLTEALKKFGSGEKVDRLKAVNDNEIGFALKAFNSMLEDRSNLEKQILEISENERKRIGQDLHDELGQVLTGVNFQMITLKEELKQNKINDTETVDYITDLISIAINKTRNIAKVLSPIIDNDLYLSIEDLINNFKKIYDIDIDFVYDKDIEITDQVLINNLYHIILESLNNAIKHGKADKILISLNNKNNIKLKITDNGKGFDKKNAAGGMGLKNINYRTELINGELKIISKSGKGTTIIVRI
ncbi:MAG: sensor histidine kinase [Spirochaetes bacterium]|nr:sensor histidine kinase [Spirochaetota bacterium]